MATLKVKPISIAKTTDVKSIGKNISDVVDFQVKTATDINRVIKEINEVLPQIVAPYDDSEIKNLITSIKKSIPVSFDDSELKTLISKAVNSIPSEFDPTGLNKSIESMNARLVNLETTASSEAESFKEWAKSQIASLKEENNALKKSLASNQIEIRSNRKEAGFKLDIVDQKLNVIMESK